MHVRTARKLLKRFLRYDQKIFMNVVVDDESWIHYFEVRTASKYKLSSMAHRKRKNALYCLKDYQCEKRYLCHIFHYYATNNSGPYTQMQVNECKAGEEKRSVKPCQILLKTSIEDGYQWYLFVLWRLMSQDLKYDIILERTG